MSATREQDKKIAQSNLAKLEELVKSNNLDEIKKNVTEAKQAMDWEWKHDKSVGIAAREAILLGQLETLRVFLEAGMYASEYVYVHGNSGGIMPLIHFAAKSGNLEMVKLLVEHGAEISERNDYYRQGDDRGLRAAVNGGHADIVEYLLTASNGANANGVSKTRMLSTSRTFLSQAAEDGNIRIVELLLQYGAHIESSIRLAHQDHKQQYGDHKRYVQSQYAEGARKSKIEYAFGYFQNQFYHRYEMKPEVKLMIDTANDALRDLDKIDDVVKNEMVEQLVSIFKKLSIDLTREKIASSLNEMVESLKKFDAEALEKKAELHEEKASYSRIIKTLLDYSFGIDFNKESSSDLLARNQYDGLSFLRGLDISGFNFIGVSVNGVPVTREMLIERKLKGADKAIVSVNDLVNVQDAARRDALTSRMENQSQKVGKLISVEGIINQVPLWRAAQIGDAAAVKARLSAGIDPNKTVDKNIPLIVAASNGHLPIVKMLIETSKINKESIVEAVKAAKDNKHEEVAEYLFDQQDINDKDANGDALLHKAVSARDMNRVRELLRKGADIELENKNGQTALQLAAGLYREKAVEMVKLLLDKGANPNHYQWQSALEKAIQEDNAELAVILMPITEKREVVRIKYNWNAKREGVKRIDPWYTDMMFEALYHNNLDILKLLKANGADFNIKSERGRTMLNVAIENLPSFSDIARTMRALVLGGYDREPERLAYTQKKMLDEAEANVQEAFKFVQFLFDNGADIKLPDKDGDTPLYLLIKKVDLGHVENEYKKILEKFLQRGADVNAKNKYGQTPLHAAASTGDKIAIEFLVKHSADINAVTENKWTPLHSAAANGSEALCKLLLELGANVEAINADGLTPVQVCRRAHESDKKSYNLSAMTKEERKYHERYFNAEMVLEAAARSENVRRTRSPTFFASKNEAKPEAGSDTPRLG